MSTTAHIWVQRAHCDCGYIWTTPGSPNVVCACGCANIENNIIVSGSAVMDEADFKAAVAQELSVSPDDLILIQQ